jgi:hypothetical protein
LFSPPAARGGCLEAQHIREICLSLDMLCCAAQKGESKGERLGSLSFAISLWNDKEMATNASLERVRSTV